MQETPKDIETVIELSKSKLVLLTIGAIGFVLAALLLWETAKLVAVLSIGFFGMCGIYGLIKLFDTKPGLIIGERGIFDNSSAIGGGLINWEDIEGFEIEQVNRAQFLLVFVNNPDIYLDRVNFFKRLWMNMNKKIYGTPLCISATSLKCNFDELITILRNRLKNTDA